MFITDMPRQEQKIDSSVINLRKAIAGKRGLIASVVLLLMASVTSLNLCAKAQSFPEYQRYVHTYLNSEVLGNWTYMEKPMFPVLFNDSQVQVSQNWSVVCPLRRITAITFTVMVNG